jgi:hypothetical protein
MLAEHTTVTVTPGGGGVTSARKIEANRRNARASTGPRTVAGKARAAQNARPEPAGTLRSLPVR